MNVIESQEFENYQAGRDIVVVTRAMDPFIVPLHGGYSYIDIDLACKSNGWRLEKSVGSLEEGENLLEKARDRLNTSTPGGVFLSAAATSTIIYSRMLRGAKEIQLMPYSDLYALVNGFEAGTLPQSSMNVLHEELVGFAQRYMGFSYPDEWQTFYEKNRINVTDLKAIFRSERAKLVGAANKFWGNEFRPKYRTRIVDVQKPWIARVITDKDGLVFEGNESIMNEERWHAGIPEALIGHELLGHLFEADSWRRAGERGEINR